MAPFGFIMDGLEEYDGFVEKQTGDRWLIASEKDQRMWNDKWHTDEYGDRSYMWDYR
jgi:hypothetical protein